MDEAGADVFHIDVNGWKILYPNFAMGLEDFKCIRENTKKNGRRTFNGGKSGSII